MARENYWWSRLLIALLTLAVFVSLLVLLGFMLF
jgi:hypothetical protein